jgi:putative aminopeptidase FrvX
MPDLPNIDKDYLVETLLQLLQTPSPTGYTEMGITKVQGYLEQLGLSTETSAKGILTATWAGTVSTPPRALTAHVDTLGAMVKEIKANGRLKLTQIGGYTWNTIEGEGCVVFTRKGTLRGSILLEKASGHVHGEAVKTSERNADTLEVRLDERTCSREETLDLGVQVGDFVAFDPRVEAGEAGFIRSRHLDDKAGVACLLTAINEFHVTICVKDRGGPYHHILNKQLRGLAEVHKIPYKVDIYPFYGSDGEAYWRAGGDVRVALIGPGVDASHNYERTHVEALIATTRLICAYLLS